MYVKIRKLEKTEMQIPQIQEQWKNWAVAVLTPAATVLIDNRLQIISIADVWPILVAHQMAVFASWAGLFWMWLKASSPVKSDKDVLIGVLKAQNVAMSEEQTAQLAGIQKTSVMQVKLSEVKAKADPETPATTAAEVREVIREESANPTPPTAPKE